MSSRRMPCTRFTARVRIQHSDDNLIIWAIHRDLRSGNACRHYDGPILAGVVAACKAPDGSYWALQQWQPNLPHRGFPPYAAGQTDWELDVSHWTGQPVTFGFAVFVVLAWLMTGPMFGFSDTWQLVINTGTTIVTFLMGQGFLD